MKGKLYALAALALLGAGLYLYLRSSSGIPDEPSPIAWDREACAHCHMQIGDPRHAAQLVTTAGEVDSFDDPGCALHWIAEHPGVTLHRLWFHGEGDRWIPADQVGFVATGATPMASGLLAVEAGTPGARTLAQVQGDLR